MLFWYFRIEEMKKAGRRRRPSKPLGRRPPLHRRRHLLLLFIIMGALAGVHGPPPVSADGACIPPKGVKGLSEWLRESLKTRGYDGESSKTLFLHLSIFSCANDLFLFLNIEVRSKGASDQGFPLRLKFSGGEGEVTVADLFRDVYACGRAAANAIKAGRGAFKTGRGDSDGGGTGVEGGQQGGCPPGGKLHCKFVGTFLIFFVRFIPIYLKSKIKNSELICAFSVFLLAGIVVEDWSLLPVGVLLGVVGVVGVGAGLVVVGAATCKWHGLPYSPCTRPISSNSPSKDVEAGPAPPPPPEAPQPDLEPTAPPAGEAATEETLRLEQVDETKPKTEDAPSGTPKTEDAPPGDSKTAAKKRPAPKRPAPEGNQPPARLFL